MKLITYLKKLSTLKPLVVATALTVSTLAGAPLLPGLSVSAAQAQQTQHYSSNELVNAGHQFFGVASSELATVIERAVETNGLPNGYILGEEGSGALIAGLRYGEGKLFTKNAGDHPVFWQGPSVGWDFGGDGNRTMMLPPRWPASRGLTTCNPRSVTPARIVSHRPWVWVSSAA